jgi:DNA-binding response OmpR family regulator/signal transduction histidine kinase
MANLRDRVLIVESDPVISDLIGRQALQAVGYQVQVATDATAAITRALQWSPDLIILDLNLPGLSGKDLMVALASHGIQTPLLIIAQRGMEADLIQAFRLGAADYLLFPVREAEVVNAVSRVLQQVHDRRAREQLSQQLQQANHELQLRVRELTTIFALGKAMTSVTDQSTLLEKILDGAVRITQADVGWFLLREDTDKPFLVAAERDLPPALGVRINQPWDDGISSLVAMSGEALSIHGEPLRRFKISALGLSALIVPVKAQKMVIGLLVMMRKQASPFGASDSSLLGALADYASISLVNARLFRALEERARAHQHAADTTQLSGKINSDILRAVRLDLTTLAGSSLAAIEQVVKDPTAHFRPDQRQQLAFIQDQQQRIQRIAETINPLPASKSAAERGTVCLNELLSHSLKRYLPVIQSGGLAFVTELPSEAVCVSGSSELLAQAVDGLISSVVRCANSGAQILLRMVKTADHHAHITVCSSRQGINGMEAKRMLQETGEVVPPPAAGRFGGAAVRLSLVKEIIERHNGKIWLENKADQGAEFHLALPLVR